MANEELVESTNSNGNKIKNCFVISPIGNDNSEIRRHVDGIIDSCIEPVLQDMGFKLYISHRINVTGSINNQILCHIYKDDLVIANLTGLNPNVMYELAFRHSLQKPVIVLKEKNDGLVLPFDLKDDRVIFYINDFMGVNDLRKELNKFISSIDFEVKADNPIKRAINDYEIRNSLFANEKEFNSENDQQNFLKYIIERLDKIDNSIFRDSTNNLFNSHINIPRDFIGFINELKRIEACHFNTSPDDVYGHMIIRHDFECLKFWCLKLTLNIPYEEKLILEERLEEIGELVGKQ